MSNQGGLFGLVTPTYEGYGQMFLYRLSMFVRTLPVMMQRLRALGLERSYLNMKKLVFREFADFGRVLSYYWRNSDTIAVYPMLFNMGDRIDYAFYNGLGRRFWELYVPQNKKDIWNKKLIYADKDTMQKLQDSLESGSSYSTVLKGFKTAIERLQVIHVLNALIANNVRPESMKSMTIFDHPATAKFAGGKVPYSINPLLGVYFGGQSQRDYPAVFATYCVNNGRIPCTEFSTEAALVELFKYVTFSSGWATKL